MTNCTRGCTIRQDLKILGVVTSNVFNTHIARASLCGRAPPSWPYGPIGQNRGRCHHGSLIGHAGHRAHGSARRNCPARCDVR